MTASYFSFQKLFFKINYSPNYQFGEIAYCDFLQVNHVFESNSNQTMRKIFLATLCVLFFFQKNLNAQMPTAEERSVQLSAEIQISPPQINLKWKEDAGASKYIVYRKSLEAQSWGNPIANLPGTATTFTDTDVEVGVGYEYAFFKEDFAPRIDTVCVAVGTEVNFTINDMYGIGLCCSFGFGNYEVKNCGIIEASGDDFGMTASSVFTTCDDGSGCSDVIIKIKTDMFENSTSWVLTNNLTGEVLGTSGAAGSFIKPRPEYGFIYAGINLPPIESHGTILLLVENSLTTPLATEIEELKMDFIKDGWQVLVRQVAADDAPMEVRSMIQNLYATEEALNAVLLLGHIPIAFSGDIFPDTHFELRGAYPADVFYGEMDGTWTDQTVNNTSANFDIYHNVPNDGKFDQSAIPTGVVELQVGRVDFFDMPAFGSSNEALIQQYLNKNHAYKTRAINPTRRALIDNNFMQAFAAPAASGFRNFSTMFGADSIFQEDYLTAMENESYLWSYGCGGGSIVSSMGIGTTNDFVTSNLQTVFTMLFGSQFGNWAYPDDFLRAPLASGQTLTNVWAGNPPWTFHHMAMGYNIGYSTLKTQNGTNGLYLDNGPQLVHVALMGDPTLRMHMVEPPSNLVFTTGGVSLDLTWAAPLNEEVAGYLIFRADSLNGKFERINSDVVTTLNFTDTNPNNGENWYMVRTLKLENSASGSYYNLSLGVCDSVSFVATAPLVVGFSAEVQEACVGDAIQFDNTSTGGIANYNWTFAGGIPATSTLENPQVTYNSTGVFDVSLEISNMFETATETKLGYVIIGDSPTANFTYTTNEATLEITDNSTNANFYFWDFGDGSSTQMEGDVTHLYANSGDYDVTLIASNECGVDTFETSINITITSLEDIYFLKNIAIFPNPTTDFLMIDFGKKINAPTSVEIFNALGQRVFSKKIKKNTNVEEVKLMDFPKGIYFVKLKNEKLEGVKKVVVE